MATPRVACRIGAALSTSASAWDAATEAARAARGGVAPQAPVDLAFLFLSPAHLDDATAAAEAVLEELEPRHLLGCVAEGVVAQSRELERGAAAAVWAAALPGAEVEAFHLELPDGADAARSVPPFDGADLVTLLVDPFTFPVAPFLAELNDRHAQVPLVGGIAVGARQPGAQALILDGAVLDAGAVGAAIAGVSVHTIVSQGCRPIGREAVITAGQGNVVRELAGKPALERLRDEIAGLSPGEQAQAAQGLLVGLVVDENRPEYDLGDFLVRGLLGADTESGALVLGESVRVGQTLRFFVRDAASADADLRRALADTPANASPAGALLFTCNGRGTSMFDEPDHDARLVAETLRTDAVAGFFCGGELGPVGGKSFLHGFTATLAVFLER